MAVLTVRIPPGTRGSSFAVARTGHAQVTAAIAATLARSSRMKSWRVISKGSTAASFPGCRLRHGSQATVRRAGGPGVMLLELSVVEQRYRVAMEVLSARVPVVEVAERYGLSR
jgi:hypothetical protein